MKGKENNTKLLKTKNMVEPNCVVGSRMRSRCTQGTFSKEEPTGLSETTGQNENNRREHKDF